MDAEEKPKPALPWGPLSAILLSLAIFLVIPLIVGLIVALFLLALGQSPGQIQDSFENSVPVQFVLVATVEALSLGVLYLFLRLRKAKISQLGLNRPVFKHLGYAALGFVVYFVLLVAALAIVKAVLPGINLEQEQDVGFRAAHTSWELLLVFLSLVILPPVTEEIIARGFLYGGLRSRLPWLPAALITSILFGLAHLQAGSGAPLLWAAGVDTFILSFVLIGLRDKSGSLWPSIFLHMTKNGLAFYYLFLNKL